MLFELCFGHPPFTSPSLNELIRCILYDELSFPEPIGSQLSTPFKHLLTRLLTKDPQLRMDWPGALQHGFWTVAPAAARPSAPNRASLQPAPRARACPCRTPGRPGLHRRDRRGLSAAATVAARGGGRRGSAGGGGADSTYDEEYDEDEDEDEPGDEGDEDAAPPPPPPRTISDGGGGSSSSRSSSSGTAWWTCRGATTRTATRATVSTSRIAC